MKLNNIKSMSETLDNDSTKKQLGFEYQIKLLLFKTTLH